MKLATISNLKKYYGDRLILDIDKFEKAITEKTKAVIINSPNNPSGVVYTVETIEKMCKVLNDKQEEYGHPIFLITDEPYRESHWQTGK